ncbi:MAG: DUF455 family protein [Polyangiaceae bacterium]|nr:DUF455 family protein [Polyangiaceae bacterium]
MAAVQEVTSEFPASSPSTSPSPSGDESVEAWALRYLLSISIEEKLDHAHPPFLRGEHVSVTTVGSAALPTRPGRPPELKETKRSKKAHTKGALINPIRRADLMHRFFHHELQAAELMLWAFLKFRDSEHAFRQGLLNVFRDEVRHMRAYRDYIVSQGYRVGDFPVRDWIWDRVSSTTTPLGFVSTMGIGFEGGNLDHTARFIEQFEAVGDEEAAAMLRVVHEEEIPHVRFAMFWFRKFRGEDTGVPFESFDAWKSGLPHPLSPAVMKGPELDRVARTTAGFGNTFMDRLHAWTLDDR